MKYFLIILSILFISSSYGLESFASQPNEIIILENNIMKFINEQDYENALIDLDKILNISPNNTNALNNKGGVLLTMGNYSDAIINFNNLLAINENNTEALNNKGIALYKQELYVQSLRSFYKSLTIDPTNENIVNNTKNVVDQLYWIDETSNGYGIVSLRDKNNNIISYSKVSEIRIQPPLGYIYLENGGNVKEIDVDGKTIKVLEFTGGTSFDRTQYVGRADISQNFGDYKIKVMELILNGFIVTPDDTLVWEVVIFNPTF